MINTYGFYQKTNAQLDDKILTIKLLGEKGHIQKSKNHGIN